MCEFRRYEVRGFPSPAWSHKRFSRKSDFCTCTLIAAIPRDHAGTVNQQKETFGRLTTPQEIYLGFFRTKPASATLSFRRHLRVDCGKAMVPQESPFLQGQASTLHKHTPTVARRIFCMDGFERVATTPPNLYGQKTAGADATAPTSASTPPRNPSDSKRNIWEVVCCC